MGLAIARSHAGPISAKRRDVHADAIDLRRRRIDADRHRQVVAPALGVHHVGEEKRLAVRLADAAAILPAHQRMQLAVLVDGVIDAMEQPGAVEPRNVLVQVGI